MRVFNSNMRIFYAFIYARGRIYRGWNISWRIYAHIGMDAYTRLDIYADRNMLLVAGFARTVAETVRIAVGGTGRVPAIVCGTTCICAAHYVSTTHWGLRIYLPMRVDYVRDQITVYVSAAVYVAVYRNRYREQDTYTGYVYIQYKRVQTSRSVQNITYAQSHMHDVLDAYRRI